MKKIGFPKTLDLTQFNQDLECNPVTAEIDSSNLFGVAKTQVEPKKLGVMVMLEKIIEMSCLHIDNQIKAGANVIQIFDSWAGLLPKKELQNYCYYPTLRIVEHIKSKKYQLFASPKGLVKIILIIVQ